MPTKRIGAAFAIGTVAAMTLAACGGGSESGGQDSAGGSQKTLTVWYMHGDYSKATMKAISKEFTQRTGAKVDFQLQEWDGITTKVTSALATDDPPDVLDLGNTQVASYAATGGLMDLTPHKKDLQQGQDWLDGLEDPATIDGKLYGVPGFAGARAVIYNKTMWKKAGITKEPTTFKELVADLRKIKKQHPSKNFSPLYLPGQFWYVGLQFVWDAGGEIATQQGGTWKPGFESPQAQQGLKDFKTFQNEFSSPGSQTLDTDKPPADTVFAGGQASAFIQTNTYLDTVKKDNPKLTNDDLGTFPMPGKSGENQPVMLGGSDWGIAAKSDQQKLALEWIKIAASPKFQNTWVFGHDRWIPNSTEAAKKATKKVPELQKAFFVAALNSKATPASPNWAKLEGTKEINHLFSDIASGSKSPKKAAAAFDAKADKTLNSDS